MTLMVGELYRKDVSQIDGHQIRDLEEKKHYSAKLNAAIRTLKTHEVEILRFVDYFTTHPELLPAQRASMEYYNSRFKKPFRRGNNLLKKYRLLGRLNAQLEGKIEWFLEEEAHI